MFILYKDRTFGEYVSETFDFLRETGKHFFKMFFTLLGLPLLIFSFMMYYFMDFYYTAITSSALNPNNPSQFEELANNNLPLFVTVFIVVFVFMIFLSVLLYSFPVLYLKLYQKNKGNLFTSSDVFRELKDNFFRILGFFILMFFTMIIITLILIIPIVISIITIIGPFVIIGFIYLFYILSLYIYLNNRELGFADTLGIAFNSIKKNFWPTIGSVVIVYLLVAVISGIFSTIVQFSTMFETITTLQNPEIEDEGFGIKKIIMAVFMTLTYILQYTLMNLPMLTGGLVYYSMQDHKENINNNNEIDLIGTQDIE